MLITFSRQSTDKWRINQLSRNRHARQIALLLNLGNTWTRIHKMTGFSWGQAHNILSNACPPFLDPHLEKPRAVQSPEPPEKRPAWSYPDADLLAIAHEARAEIQANLAARARR